MDGGKNDLTGALAHAVALSGSFFRSERSDGESNVSRITTSNEPVIADDDSN
jgi:hypothetical protein